MQHILINNTQIEPSKIVCVGRNYAEHAKELKNEIPQEPVIFIKPNSAISDLLSPVHVGDTLHYEGELCFTVDDKGFNTVGFGLDLTKRDLQSRLKSKGLPWERAKAFDGSALFSRFVPISCVSNDLRFELYINNQLTQSGHIREMQFSPLTILNNLMEFMTLEPGDILMTGTSSGVGPVKTGDLFYAKVLDGNNLLTEGKWQAEQ